MRKVHVNVGKSYDVLIERGLMAQCGAYIKDVLGKTCTAVILTDDNVDALYGDTVQQSLENAGFGTCRFAIPHGEENKNLQIWQTMLDYMAEQRVTRTDLIVALGGGVVGDMAGFAAASYLRGISFVQMPTTLLAMVDSSVGGKTGVNLPAGKNLVGAFCQPKLVLCDPDALRSLDADVLADGVGESIKYGVLGNKPLFDLLATADWMDQTEHVIESCVSAKARLVEEDELDTGSRQYLNLGHTLGHAVERCSNYQISHGHAVAIGMVYATRLAVSMGICPPHVLDEIIDMTKRNHLPTSAPFTPDMLCTVAQSDKKRAGDQLTFVLPHRIGECELHRVDIADLPELVQIAVGA
ncbi:MAG: 3-dehydroquinate synthase [Clostridiales bacterium]|nr:3-dehydroquinate synthase [Clostridiales bacterium]